ncbi:Pol protein [Phytophthora palmivora]|uniref:Pol protein n=1 Tax=Phytophthora palmivora TaxID=4796 RepID=A0A2P4XA13_9STRA|nr:Pol protein [Phytophthora palmivora]
MKYDILLEAHDAPISGHLGRAKTYQAVSQTFGGPACMRVVNSVESNKLKHRFIRPFAVLARHGAEAYTIDLPQSMATHSTFYVGRLKRYHDPLAPSPRTEGDQGESSPPQNEAESSEQPELPVSKPVNETQAGTHASHTKGMTVPSGKNLGKNYTHKPSGTSTPVAHKRAYNNGGSQNTAVNTPVERSGFTTNSVHILTKDLNDFWIASPDGILTTKTQSEGYLDRVHAIPKRTDFVA